MVTFKSTNGKWLTKALFFEQSLVGETRHYAIYTLKDDDHIVDGVVYKSLKKLFLECEDPTEYEFATTYLGGWKHWVNMQGVNDLKPFIEEWREEYNVKLRSIGVQKIVEMAKSEGGYQAAKWLADKQWIDHPRGRPSKQEILKNTKEKTKIKKRLSGDVAKLVDFKRDNK
mgnify:CR=1 FL=1